MCSIGMEMLTGTNERIVYYPLPLRVDGYDDKNVVSLQAEGAVGSFRYLSLIDENFKVAKHDFIITQETTLRLNLPETPFLGLSFNLKNEVAYHIAGLGQGIFLKGQFNMLSFRSIDVEYQFKVGDHSIVSIEISDSYFQRLTKLSDALSKFDQARKNRVATVFSPTALYGGDQMTRVLNMLMLANEKKAGWILAEGKIRELIWLCVSRMQSTRLGKPIRLTTKQEEAIRNAYNYLMHNLNTHISLDIVANKYGISKYKLTKGFKYLHGIELSDYILNERMQLAHHLLETEGKTVSEVSKALGYGSPQNFTPVFLNRFGYYPSQVLKDGKKLSDE